MTREEALKQIEELKKYIEEMDTKVGYKDDEIFLLSVEEYEKYKDEIPKIKKWWWLRSPGINHFYLANVDRGGSVFCSGNNVLNNISVRPALHLEYSDCQIGSRIIKYNFPWIVIDKNLAIAEVPIGFEKFDDKSNNYENSYIRKWLKEWKINR